MLHTLTFDRTFLSGPLAGLTIPQTLVRVDPSRVAKLVASKSRRLKAFGGSQVRDSNFRVQS